MKGDCICATVFPGERTESTDDRPGGLRGEAMGVARSKLAGVTQYLSQNVSPPILILERATPKANALLHWVNRSAQLAIALLSLETQRAVDLGL